MGQLPKFNPENEDSVALILYFSAINKKRLHSINAAHLTFFPKRVEEILSVRVEIS